MIKIISGNILNAKEDVIGHQVNCRGSMSAGLSKQIKKKFPDVYHEYKNKCLVYSQSPELLLGKCQIVYTKNKIIANLFGQLDYSRYKKQTNYKALSSALLHLYNFVKEKNLTIALPYKIGCGLAGGDWDVVMKLIKNVFNDYGIVLYKLEE